MSIAKKGRKEGGQGGKPEKEKRGGGERGRGEKESIIDKRK
jgi:hypothetical protein